MIYIMIYIIPNEHNMKQVKYPNILQSIILIACSILITSCGNKQDGPPKYQVNTAQIPNAIPQKEQSPPKKHSSSYVINGNRYHILNSSLDYNKVGYASWYGTKFHGKLTATGEKYNMLAMTAANKELPIPCYAEVTNLNNNKKVVVKINDRGPFVLGRIIDLSYVAAAKLGMLGKGTTKVRVKTITSLDQKYQNNKILEPKVDKKIFLQLGAFHNKDTAIDFADKVLDKAKYLSKIITIKSKNSTLYKVHVGPFESMQAANYAIAFLVKNNLAKEVLRINT
jgi:rare lipoprotein A